MCVCVCVGIQEHNDLYSLWPEVPALGVRHSQVTGLSALQPRFAGQTGRYEEQTCIEHTYIETHLNKTHIEKQT